MSYLKQTINNKSIIKKFSHRKRFKVATKLFNLKANESILDYGTGNGYLLITLAELYPESNIYGYEPIDSMFKELQVEIINSGLKNIQVVDNLEEVGNMSFDFVSCFEVLEHFSDSTLQNHILAIKNLVSNTGEIVISVPIETGLSSIFKNSVRFFVKQQHGNSSFKNIIRSVFSLPINRNDTEYINSHIGFNYKNLEQVFKNERLQLKSKHYSPFKFLYGMLNSQVFYCLKK